jgi:hypothetical protein
MADDRVLRVYEEKWQTIDIISRRSTILVKGGGLQGKMKDFLFGKGRRKEKELQLLIWLNCISHS